MVQRLIRRSWRASLVCFGLLCTALMLWLLPLGDRQEIAGQGPPPPPGGGGGGGGEGGSDVLSLADAKPMAVGTPFSWCVNYPLGNGETDCSCLIGGWAGSNTSSGMGRPHGTCFRGASVIDNWSFNYVHSAQDYSGTAQSGTSASCQTCTGSTGATSGSKWGELSIDRLHRFRDVGHISSFGPGVFSRFDIKLHLLDNIMDTTGTFPSTKVIDLIDPTTMYPGRFLETGVGLFEETEVNEFGQLHLLRS